MKFPEELKYSKEHEWVRIDGNVAYVGITDFAQKELGEIVYVDVTSEGEALAQGDVFGSIEAVKTVSDLFLPIDAVVLELNGDLEDSPELINSEPYGKGWIVKVEVKDASQIEGLLSATAYKEMIGA